MFIFRVVCVGGLGAAERQAMLTENIAVRERVTAVKLGCLALFSRSLLPSIPSVLVSEGVCVCVCVSVPNKDMQVLVGNNLPRDRRRREDGEGER